MSLSSDNTVMTMPVAPAYNNGNCGNGMWGGDWASWIILFLIFGMFGWGGYGGGYGGLGGGINSPAGQGALTRADLCSEFNFNNLDNAVRGVQQGICDSTYALNTSLLNGFNSNNVAMLQGFNGVQSQLADCCCTTQRAIDNAAFQTAQGINSLGSQLASCCCDTQRQIERGFCDTNYNLATNTTNIIQNAHNDTDRVIAKLDAMENTRQQERIAALQAENQSLKFQASQVAQNAFITANQDAQTAELIRRINPMPVPAYQVPNPYAGCGCYSSCGC